MSPAMIEERVKVMVSRASHEACSPEVELYVGNV
jgi:hypothetical protein